MKFKQTIILADLGEDYAAVPFGEGERNYMVRLNATGADIWRGIEAGLSPEQIAQKLTEEYEVDLPHAEKAVADVIAKLRAEDLLED